jgi:hypothetical protein
MIALVVSIGNSRAKFPLEPKSRKVIEYREI